MVKRLKIATRSGFGLRVGRWFCELHSGLSIDQDDYRSKRVSTKNRRWCHMPYTYSARKNLAEFPLIFVWIWVMVMNHVVYPQKKFNSVRRDSLMIQIRCGNAWNSTPWGGTIKHARLHAVMMRNMKAGHLVLLGCVNFVSPSNLLVMSRTLVLDAPAFIYNLWR